MLDLPTIFARAAVRSLAEAGVTGKEVLCASISDMVPVEWRAMPITPLEAISGVLPTVFSPYLLHDFSVEDAWDTYVEQLNLDPKDLQLDDTGGRAGLAERFGLGEFSPLVFSVPDADDRLAGVTFAMEMATLLKLAKVGNLLTNASNYYVNLSDGRCVGVRAGKPTIASDRWDSLGDYVGAQVHAPRGRLLKPRGYSVVERIAQWGQNNYQMVPDMETFLAALTPMRFAGTFSHRAGLEDYMWGVQSLAAKNPRLKQLAAEQAKRDHRERMESAKAIFENWSLGDPQKMWQMKDLLVPSVLSASTFNKRFINPANAKTVMTGAQVRRIDASLAYYLETLA